MILDEVHAVAGTKRGAHLALSLERLERLVDGSFQRVGLSATQRPMEEIGRFVAGTGREIRLVDAGVTKELDLQVVVPVEDMRELGATSELSVPPLADGVQMGVGVEQSSRSIWPSIYPAILELCASTARRSCSSTTDASQSGSRSGSTSSPARSSRAPITGRLRGSSASSWRSS